MLSITQPGVRRVLDRLRTNFPTAYWRARNGVALAEWYGSALRTRLRGNAATEPYDAAFWDFHETGDWDGFARTILHYYPARSIVDVGCGQGLALHGLARVDPTLQLRGFDSSRAALERAQSRGLTVQPLDLVALTKRDAETRARDMRSFDLALCLEVAEHLPAWHSGKLLTLLTGTRQIVFSAAHPNQGGRLHVNERPASYWIERFGRRGFHLSPSNDEFRSAVARLALPPWFGQNVNAFTRA
jgi:SAM-dependent methyltransferase